jgi:glucokinase
MTRTATLGIDLGGTRIKGTVLDADGAVLWRDDRAVEHEVSAQALAEAIGSFAAAAAAASPVRVAAAGIGVPGVVDPATGALVGTTPHVPAWSDFPVRAALAERLGLPVAADNDANCAALAELRMGAARGAATAVMITLGTGLGAALISGGALVRGWLGGAGELGHLPIGSGEVACRCGVPGCVEPELSGEGLARIARARGLPWRDAPEVFAAAAAGHRDAVAMVARMADRLAVVVAIAAQMLDPERMVIGGGVAAAGEALLGRLRPAVARYAPGPWSRGMRIEAAAMGKDAGAIGAAILGREAAAAP